MNNEDTYRASTVIEDPTQKYETPIRVNVDVLKRRLIERNRKNRVNRTIILSTLVVSLGALTMLTY